MSAEPQEPYKSLIGDFNLVCRNCKRIKLEHAGENCLLDSTYFYPMNAGEWYKWTIGVDALRESNFLGSK